MSAPRIVLAVTTAAAAPAELLRVPLRPGDTRRVGRRVLLQVEGVPNHAEDVVAAARIYFLVEGYGSLQADLAHVALYPPLPTSPVSHDYAVCNVCVKYGCLLTQGHTGSEVMSTVKFVILDRQVGTEVYGSGNTLDLTIRCCNTRW